MSEMFFAYLVQKFLQFLFTHYFLFFSIISRLFGLKYHLESRDSSSLYNQPLQKEQIQFLLLWTDKHQVLVRFKRMPKSRAFGVHQGPKGLHKRYISSSFGTAKINARYCCCSRVQA